jgi:hypothetical protein
MSVILLKQRVCQPFKTCGVLNLLRLGDTFIYDDHDHDHVRQRIWTAVTNRCLLHPHRWYMSMENNGGMRWQGKTGSSTRALWQSCLQSSSSKSGGTWRREWWILSSKYLCSYEQVIFTCRKILRHLTCRFTSRPKEVVLRIFMAPRNPSPSARFEPANLGCSSKHANHWTIYDDTFSLTFRLMGRRIMNGINLLKLHGSLLSATNLLLQTSPRITQ